MVVTDASSAETAPVHSARSTINVLGWLENSKMLINARISIKNTQLFEAEQPDNPTHWWPSENVKDKQYNHQKNTSIN
jgi:hypothetical protein